MYDIAQEFKKWFYLRPKDEIPCNLHDYPAFNYRDVTSRVYYSIFSIFQPNCCLSNADLCQRMHLESLHIRYRGGEKPPIDTNKTNWRQAYILKFNL